MRQLLTLRQRVDLEIISRRRFKTGMAGGGNRDVLTALMLVGHGAGLGTGGEARFPNEPAALGLK